MPHSTSAPRLGDLERVVMEHLWEAAAAGGPGFDGATVREVHDRFDGEREIAYTTVMTVLDRLAKKGLVTRERDGRAWRYLPADTREALTAADDAPHDGRHGRHRPAHRPAALPRRRDDRRDRGPQGRARRDRGPRRRRAARQEPTAPSRSAEPPHPAAHADRVRGPAALRGTRLSPWSP